MMLLHDADVFSGRRRTFILNPVKETLYLTLGSLKPTSSPDPKGTGRPHPASATAQKLGSCKFFAGVYISATFGLYGPEGVLS
jgi:hypothetical protein